MPDHTGRSSGIPAARSSAAEADKSANNGWGSPVPAEYGSLRTARPARPAAAPSPARQAGGAGVSVAAALVKRLQTVGESRTRGRNGSRGSNSANGSAAKTNGATSRAASRLTRGAASVGARAARGARTAAAPIVRSNTAAPTARSGVGRTSGAEAPDPTSPTPAPPARRRTAAEPPLAITREQRRDAATLRAQRSRSRATIRHVDVWTVVRVSVVFYAIAAVVIVAASLLLWYAADAFGTLPSIEKSIRTLFGLKSFKIHAGTVAGYMSLAGVVLTITGAIANVLAALIYNLISDAVGGVRVELEAPRPRRPTGDRPEV